VKNFGKFCFAFIITNSLISFHLFSSLWQRRQIIENDINFSFFIKIGEVELVKILGVDTSNKIASVAVYENGKILGEKFSDDQKTHSEKVLPIIDELLKEINIQIKEIDQFVVCTGPGSFTGIRIGVSLVKGMAEGLGKRVIGVTSLQGLLNSTLENSCAVIDARHENVYAQYKINGKYSEARCMNIQEVIIDLPQAKITFVEDAVNVHKEIIEKSNYKINDKKQIQSASDLIDYAIKNNLEAKNPEEVNPVYLRKAQPER